MAAITEDNNRLRRENGMIATEIESLESGTDAVIEQARTQLGMIRSDEVLFRFVPEGSKEARDSLKHAPGQTGAFSSPSTITCILRVTPEPKRKISDAFS